MGMHTSPGTDHIASLVAGFFPAFPSLLAPVEDLAWLSWALWVGTQLPSVQHTAAPRWWMWQGFEGQLETQKHNELRGLGAVRGA